MDMLGDLCAIGLPILLLVAAVFIYGARQGGLQRELGDAYWRQHYEVQDRQATAEALRRQMRGMENVADNSALARFQQSVLDFQLRARERLTDAGHALNLTAYEVLTPPPIPELTDPIPPEWQAAITDMARTLRELREGPVRIKFKSYGKAPAYAMGRANPRAFGPGFWTRPPATEIKCGVCGTTIEDNEGLGCSGCHTPHHHACWDYNGQCAVFGCQCDISEDLGSTERSGSSRSLPKPTHGESYLA
jgi:hypothetical protein